MRACAVCGAAIAEACTARAGHCRLAWRLCPLLIGICSACLPEALTARVTICAVLRRHFQGYALTF